MEPKPPIPPKPANLAARAKLQSAAHTVRVLLEMYERVNRPDASLGVAKMAESPTTHQRKTIEQKQISLEDLELALQEASRTRASRLEPRDPANEGRSPRPWESGWIPGSLPKAESKHSHPVDYIQSEESAPSQVYPSISSWESSGLGLNMDMTNVPAISTSSPDTAPEDVYNVPMSDALKLQLEHEPSSFVEAKQLTFGRMSVKRGRGSNSLAYTPQVVDGEGVGVSSDGLPLPPTAQLTEWTDPGLLVLSMQHFTIVPTEKLGTHLHTLVLSYNKLESFSGDVVKALPKLECLDLSGNLIANLPWKEVGETWGQSKGKFASSNNRWSVYSSTSTLAMTDSHVSYRGLRELWLGKNQLRSVGIEASWLVGLEVLDLGYNQISVLPPTLFEHAVLLSHVSLSHNPLTQLPSSLGLRQSSLRTFLVDDLNLEQGLDQVVNPYMSAVRRCMELERSPSPSRPEKLQRQGTLAREVARATRQTSDWVVGSAGFKDHTLLRRGRGHGAERAATLRAPSPNQAPRMSGDQMDLLRRKHRLMRRLLLHLRDVHDLDPWVNFVVGDEKRLQTEELLHDALAVGSLHKRQPSEQPYTPKTEKSLRKKDKPPETRVRVLQEILATERTYVRELQTLQDLYATPSEGRMVPVDSDGNLSPNFVQERVLAPEEQKIVFQNLGMILKLHRDHLLPALEEAVADGLGQVDEETLRGRVGRCFARYAPFFKLYSTYYNGFDQALDFLDDLDSNGERGRSPVPVKAMTRQKWRNLMDQARSNRRHTQLNLQSYLLLPVQRLPRYRMLLETLWEVTPTNHPDEMELTQAVEDVALRVRECNDQKKEWEGMQTVVTGIVKQIKRRDDDALRDLDWGSLSLPQQYQIQEQVNTRVKLQQQQMTEYPVKDDSFKPILPSSIISPRSTSKGVRKSVSSDMSDGWVSVDRIEGPVTPEMPSPVLRRAAASPAPSSQSSTSRISTGDILSWTQAATLSTGSELLRLMTSRRRLLKSCPWRIVLACFRDSVPDLEVAQFLQMPLANIPLTQQSGFVKPDPRYPTMVATIGETGGVIKTAIPSLPIMMEQKRTDESGVTVSTSSVVNIVGRDDELILFADVLLWCRILPNSRIREVSPGPGKGGNKEQPNYRYELIKAMDLDGAGNTNRHLARLVDVADLPCAIPGYTTVAAREEEALLSGQTLQESRFLRIADPIGDVVLYAAVPNPYTQQQLNPMGLGAIQNGSGQSVMDPFLGGSGEREAEEWVDLINNGSSLSVE
jgi:hypothetical protein